ncbi:MAG TPA: hypothetical protein VFW87_05715, partial [Pirellulales bacterium]|nr:hypothetical protein [Pirellulales bacterium]
MPLPKVVYFFPQDANDINSKAYRCSVYCGCDIDDALILFQWEGDAKSFASAVKSLGSDSPISYTGDRDSIRQWLSGQQSQYGAALM